ncbi:MAG TPA: FAD-dependent oxidoreductase [Gemmataceae bacterium]|nr:FAD-dependent oxidoreductase [Gemmataceae bacterium]
MNGARRRLLGAGVAALAGVIAAPRPARAGHPAHARRWDGEFDVIVVGFGVSGAAAAYEALKAGATVLVLDRGSAAANESHGGYFYLGGGTALQRALKVEDTPENMYKFLIAAYQPAPAEDKIRVYSERSPEHYEWLVKLGIPFGERLFDDAWPTAAGVGLYFSGEEQSWPYREIAVPAQRGHMPSLTGLVAGKRLQQLLLDAAREAGATPLLAADAQTLAMSTDGRVEGVLALVDGKTRAFRAHRGLILATGGFANNRDMVAIHTPQFLDNTPIDVGSNDGWGHRAGEAVGAALERMDGAVAYFNLYPPLSRKQGLLVNAQGQRFIHEDAYYGKLGYAIVRTQGGVAHLVLDAPALGDLNEMAGPRRANRGPVIAAQAPTIAEIERGIGVPEQTLQRTVEFYNHFAAKGEDPLFHKNPKHVRPLTQPPFTALKASVKDVYFPFFTMGGLRTNARTEVLDSEDKPIAGLFAVGRVAAGISTPYYVTSGSSMGEGTLFGRIAGVNAAANGRV